MFDAREVAVNRLLTSLLCVLSRPCVAKAVKNHSTPGLAVLRQLHERRLPTLPPQPAVQEVGRRRPGEPISFRRLLATITEAVNCALGDVGHHRPLQMHEANATKSNKPASKKRHTQWVACHMGRNYAMIFDSSSTATHGRAWRRGTAARPRGRADPRQLSPRHDHEPRCALWPPPPWRSSEQ